MLRIIRSTTSDEGDEYLPYHRRRHDPGFHFVGGPFLAWGAGRWTPAEDPSLLAGLSSPPPPSASVGKIDFIQIHNVTNHHFPSFRESKPMSMEPSWAVVLLELSRGFARAEPWIPGFSGREKKLQHYFVGYGAENFRKYFCRGISSDGHFQKNKRNATCKIRIRISKLYWV